jgi:hypothetical protein
MSNADEALDTFLRALAKRGTAVEVRDRFGDAEPAGSVIVNLGVGEWVGFPGRWVPQVMASRQAGAVHRDAVIPWSLED